VIIERMSRTAVACALALLLSASAGSAVAQSGYEAAKQEGKLVWYTTFIVPQAAQPIADAFMKKYPGIDVALTRADSIPTALKILAEGQAGRVQADIADGIETAPPLLKANLLQGYAPNGTQAYPAEMKDPNGLWHAVALYFLTPGINTNLVPKGTEPRTLEALLDPKWQGKMAWSLASGTGGSAFVGAVLASLGEDRGMAYLRQLQKQKIIGVGITARAIVDQVINGEYPIALEIFNHHTVISANQGAPVTWVPLEPILGIMAVASVVKNAPHPAAARLFMDFLISEECQQILARADYLPAMPSVPAKTPSLKPEGGGFKALFMSPQVMADNSEKWTRLRKDLFD
jgi:ABC-type Fe3+ transport system substrate-binding protein